jgi:drug/metabolite transporter (DMT)-like permease
MTATGPSRIGPSSDGARYMILAVVFFALAHAIVKWLGHLSYFQLVFVRQAVALVICALMLWKKGIRPWGTNKLLLITRGLVGTLALVTYFYSLHHLPLASAVTFQFLSPIFTLVFAHYFLKEPSAPRTWFYFLFAFFGVCLVKGFDARVSYGDLGIAMVSVVASAAAYTSVRALKASDHELVVVFYFPFVTLPVMAPVAFRVWTSPTATDWMLILTMGAFTFLAQLFMTMAYQRDRAEDIGIYNYLGLPIALAIGYGLFGETFSLLSVVGMAVILVGVVGATRSITPWRRRKDPSPPPAYQ